MKINLLILELFSLLVWNYRLCPLWQKSDIAALLASWQGLAWHLCCMPKSDSSFTTQWLWPRLSSYTCFTLGCFPFHHCCLTSCNFWLKRSLCYIIIKEHSCISSSDKIKMYILTLQCFLVHYFFILSTFFSVLYIPFFLSWSCVVLSSKLLSFFSGEKSTRIR